MNWIIGLAIFEQSSIEFFFGMKNVSGTEAWHMSPHFLFEEIGNTMLIASLFKEVQFKLE